MRKSPGYLTGWVPVNGWEDFYQIHPQGYIRRIHERYNGPVHHVRPILGTKTGTKPRGRYETVTLYIDGRKEETRVHQLVARTFKGRPCSGCDVHHRNWDHRDNHDDNLQYVPHNEHMAMKKPNWRQVVVPEAIDEYDYMWSN